MEINQDLIFDISGEGGLKARIDNLKDQFSKAGGANELAKIRKKQAEHDRKMEQLEASENSGMMPSMHNFDPDAAGN